MTSSTAFPRSLVNEAPAIGRLRVLDATAYAERFLALGSRDRANCDRAHVMSVIYAVNEKFRQGVDGFGAFGGRERGWI